MWLQGHYFDEALIKRINAYVREKGEVSTREVSQEVCRWLKWVDSRGRLQEGSCRKALYELERLGKVALPRKGERVREWGRIEEGGWEGINECGEIRGRLEELGKVELILVEGSRRKEGRIWRWMMERYHERGPRMCGGQVKYVIWSERYGWIGGIGFSSATKALKARDEWIGWRREARRENLRYVVKNARFLILPWVKVKNLGSYVLSKALKRLEGDWEERYGVRPVLVETFVDERKHKGTVYQASGWERIGETSGRGGRFPNGGRTDGKKAIYVKALRRDFRVILQRRREMQGLEPRPDMKGGGKWYEEVARYFHIDDRRLVERMIKILKRFWEAPGKEIGKACHGNRAEMRATYRFFSNEEVTPRKVIRAAKGEALKRMRKQDVVLIVQDQTSMNYGRSRTMREVFGPVGAVKGNGGVRVHGVLAVAEDKTPLGLVGGYAWKRSRRLRGKKRRAKRARMSIASKESKYWLWGYRDALELARTLPKTTFVVVGDRDMDVYALWRLWQRHAEPKPHILVRVNRSRSRMTTAGVLLSEALDDTPWQGELTVQIRRDRKDVNVKLDLRYKKIELAPPKSLSKKKANACQPIVCWLVEVKENQPPDHIKKPLHWLLVTTFPVKNLNDAQRVVTWYARRWMIEVYFKVLKTACRHEIRRLRTEPRLKVALAIDMIIAWRILIYDLFRSQ